MGPTTISYPPHLRLPHCVGVGSVLARRRVSPFFQDSLARASLMASAPSLSFFPRLPGSSLPHGVSAESLYISFFLRHPGSSLPSWRRCWLAAESLSLLEIPSQEFVYVNMQLTRPNPTLQAGLTITHK